MKPECKQCDFEKAKHIGRAHWVCGECGRDLGIEYYLWAEEVHPEWLRPDREETAKKIERWIKKHETPDL